MLGSGVQADTHLDARPCEPLSGGACGARGGPRALGPRRGGRASLEITVAPPSRKRSGRGHRVTVDSSRTPVLRGVAVTGRHVNAVEPASRRPRIDTAAGHVRVRGRRESAATRRATSHPARGGATGTTTAGRDRVVIVGREPGPARGEITLFSAGDGRRGRGARNRLRARRRRGRTGSRSVAVD